MWICNLRDVVEGSRDSSELLTMQHIWYTAHYTRHVELECRWRKLSLFTPIKYYFKKGEIFILINFINMPQYFACASLGRIWKLGHIKAYSLRYTVWKSILDFRVCLGFLWICKHQPPFNCSLVLDGAMVASRICWNFGESILPSARVFSPVPLAARLTYTWSIPPAA